MAILSVLEEKYENVQDIPKRYFYFFERRLRKVLA